MSPKRQTWHDMIASTYVVKTDDAGNIKMDGLAAYKKEPIKHSVVVEQWGLVVIGFMVLVVYGVVLLGQSLTNGSMNTDYKYDGQSQIQL